MTQGSPARLLGAVMLLGALLGCNAPGEGPVVDEAAEPPAQGPLEALVGWAAPLDGAAGMIEQMRVREERIAGCMTEQGFEYFPDVPAPDEVIAMEGPAQGTREWVERYGFGIWTPVTDEAGAFEFSSEPSTERREYLAAMSPTELEAYHAALWGPVTKEHPDGSVTRSGGCMAVGYDGIGDQDEYLAQVREEAIAFLTALDGDPAFGELDARWSECMAAEGMSFAAPFRARESLSEGLDELFEQAAIDGTDPFGSPEVAERAVQEKQVALADLDCRESLDYDRQHKIVAHELQAGYVEAHREDLDLLVAAQGG